MERAILLGEINGIFVKTLDNEAIVLSETTRAPDIAEWDSLTHVELVVAIEKHFKIRFSSREILSWDNVGQMMDAIQQKGV
jgi:acyl carrier protein